MNPQVSHCNNIPIFEQLEGRQLLSVSTYAVTALVTNGTVGGGDASGGAIDTTLKNPWGLVAGPKGMELATNHSGYIMGYKGNGTPVVAHAILPTGSMGPGQGSGIVYNGTKSFIIPGATKPATYIAATEDGTIVAWNPTTSAHTPTTVVNNSPGTAQYEALAQGSITASGSTRRYLYATDFTSKSVDVYNSNFHKVHLAGNFTDPNVPTNYSPFGILVSGNSVYVTYCQLEISGDEDHDGVGLGMVAQFKTNGTFVKDLASIGGKLNAPYGMAVAPKAFGTYGGDLIIGDFGDSTLNAYNPTTGALKQLKGTNGSSISVDGSQSLWGITFGNGLGGTDKKKLYFTAGTNNEAGAVFGYVSVTSKVLPKLVTRAYSGAFSTISIAVASHKQDPSSDLSDIVDA